MASQCPVVLRRLKKGDGLRRDGMAARCRIDESASKLSFGLCGKGAHNPCCGGSAETLLAQRLFHFGLVLFFDLNRSSSRTRRERDDGIAWIVLSESGCHSHVSRSRGRLLGPGAPRFARLRLCAIHPFLSSRCSSPRLSAFAQFPPPEQSFVQMRTRQLGPREPETMNRGTSIIGRSSARRIRPGPTSASAPRP